MAMIIGGHETGLQNSSAELLNRNDQTAQNTVGHGEQLAVNISNGNLVLMHQDVFMPSLGDDYQLERTYNSRGRISGSDPYQGATWNFSTTIELKRIDDGNGQSYFEVIYGDGSIYDYHLDADTGRYVSTDGAGAFESIEDLGDGADPRYLLVRGDQTRLSFDSQGRLVRLEDNNGIAMGYTYEGDRLTQVLDDQGHVVTYIYDNGRLFQVTDDTEGVLVEYHYDADGRLWEVIDRAGHSTQYFYTATGDLERIVLPERQMVDDREEISSHRELTFGYETVSWPGAGTGAVEARVLTRITDAMNQVTDIEYDFEFEAGGSATNGITTVVDALGNSRAYSNDSTYLQWRLDNGYYEIYDVAQAAADPGIQAQVDAIRATCSMTYVYRQDGYITEVIDQQGFHTRYEYDDQDNLVRTIDANGWGAVHNDGDYFRNLRAELGVIDAGGNGKFTTELTQDDIDTLTEAFTSHFEYDARGNMVKHTDNADNITSYTFTDFNKVESITTGVGHARAAAADQAVNGGYYFQYASNPVMAALADGGYVTAFADYYGADGDSRGVFLQRYDALGTEVGTKVQVNTHTSSYQYQPVVTSLADGGYAVIWASYLQDGDRWGVYGQRFDADSNAVGEEFLVNTTTASFQFEADISSLADGGFVVTWTSMGQDGSGYGVFAQRFDADGNKAGVEFQVNSFTTSTQMSSSVSALDDGGFLVAWSSYNQDGDGMGIFAQRFDADGNAVGAERQINTHTASHQLGPVVETLAGGGFVITWMSYLQDGSHYGVFGQCFDADANMSGVEFQINTHTQDAQFHHAVAATPDGGFAVVWQSMGQDGSDYGIFGQCYDASGSRRGSEFLSAVTTEADQGAVAVEVFADGEMVVAYASEYTDDTGRTYHEVLQSFISADQVRSGQINDLRESRVTDPMGVEAKAQLDLHTTYFEYDENQNLEKRIDAGGDITRYFYDSLGRLDHQIVYLDPADMEDPAKQQITRFGYDGFGNNTSVTDPEGNRIVRIFDHFGNLNHFTDAKGRTTDYTYDGDNRLRTVTDPEGNLTINAYDAVGNRIRITDPSGHFKQYYYDPNNRLFATLERQGASWLGYRVERFFYDEVGNRTSVLDAERNVTEYRFNSRRQLVEVITPEVADENGDPVRYSSSFGYDGVGNRVYSTDFRANTTEVIYTRDNLVRQQTAADGQVTRFEYDANGNQVKIIAGYQLPADKRQILQFSYDEENQLVSGTDAEGRVSSYAYDAPGNRVAVIDANGHAVASSDEDHYRELRRELGYVDGQGQGKSAADLTGAEIEALKARYTTEYEYDGANRLIHEILPEVIDPDTGQPVSHTIIHEYDVNGNKYKVTDGNSHTTTYTYDRDNRLVMVEDANQIKTVFEYDSRDNRTAVIIGADASADEDGRITLADIDQARITRYAYNDFGELETKTDGMGNALAESDHDRYRQMRINLGYAERVAELSDEAVQALRELYTEHYTYDRNGNRTTVTDHMDRTTTYGYDALDRLESTIDALSNTTSMRYDGNGNLKTVTDANNRVTSYKYDSLDRLTDTTRTDSRKGVDVVNHREYDTFGNLSLEAEAFGSDDARTIRYEYDLNNRMSRMIDASENSQGYEYDAVGNRIRVVDRRTNATDYFYDALNRNIKIIDPLSFETRFEYDGAGNKCAVIDARGAVTRFDYDAGNRLVSTTDAKQRVTRYEYDATGNRIEQRTAFGTSDEQLTVYEYDAVGNLRRVTDAAGGITESDYDRVYNLTRFTDANGNDSSTGFDALNQAVLVTDAAGNVTEYSYDPVGNRTTVISAIGHAVATSDAAHYVGLRQQAGIVGADGQGKPAALLTAGDIAQLKEMFTTHYDYDDFDRVLTVTDPEDTVTRYAYDLAGNRTSITRADGTGEAATETFEYDDNGRLVASISAEGNSLATSNDPDYQDKRTAKGLPSLVEDLSPEQIQSLLDGHTTGHEYDENGNLTLVTDPLGKSTEYRYDENNRVQFVIDAMQHEVEYRYDGNGNRIQVIDARDNITTHYYDPDNRLKTTVDGEGYATRFFYDANGNLDYQTLYMTPLTLPVDPEGMLLFISNPEKDQTTSFEYDALNRITARIDGEDRRTEYTYDALGNELTRTDANGDAVVRLDDDYYRNIRKAAGITDAQGLGKLANQLSDEEIVQLKALFTSHSYYDKANRLTASVTAEGYLTEMEYDAAGNLIGRARYDAPVIIPQSGPPEPVADAQGQVKRRLEQMAYDRNRRMVQQTRWTGFHGASGERIDTKYEYDLRGNRKAVIDAAGSADERTTAYAYDDADRMTQVTDAEGYVTRYELDAYGNRVFRYEDWGGEKQRQTKYYYDPRNLLFAEIIGNGTSDRTINLYHYDGNGNLDRTLKGHFSSDRQVEQFEYDANNRLTGEQNGELEWTRYLYDGAGNRTDVIVAPDLVQERSNTFEYDRGNRRVADVDGEQVRTEYVYDAAGNKIETIQAMGLGDEQRHSHYQYDADNRLVAVTDPMGGTTGYSYDVLGNQTRIVSPNGGIQNNSFDALGRMLTNLSAGDILTVNTYDLRGNITSATQSFGDGTDARITTYGYDKLDQQILITDPEAYSTTIAYDPFGNQELVTHGQYLLNPGDEGYDEDKAHHKKVFVQSNTFKYDVQDRMISMEDAEGDITSYGYDVHGNRIFMISANGNALATKDNAAAGNDYYRVLRRDMGYTDSLGDGKRAVDLTDAEKQELRDAYTTRYEYDDASRLVRTITPEGGITVNRYDDAGDMHQQEILQSVDDDGNEVWITKKFEYNGNGWLKAEVDDYDVRTEYDYDAMGNRTFVHHAVATTDARSTETRYDLNNRVSAEIDGEGNRTGYAYDAMGNRIRVTDPRGYIARYYYDGSNNLIGVLDAEGIYNQYEYDSAGNRTKEICRAEPFQQIENSTSPAVGKLADGGWVTAFTVHDGLDGSDDGIFLRRYGADGSIRGGLVQVNSHAAGDQSSPSVAGLGDGGFVVTWHASGQSGAESHIFAQRYDAEGNPQDEEFQISTDARINLQGTLHVGEHEHGNVVALPDGGFTVFWELSYPTVGRDYIYGRRFDADGNALGPSFRVNSHTSANMFTVDAAVLSDGGILATWNSFAPDSSGSIWRSRAFGRRFNAAGDPMGSDFEIILDPDVYASLPSVAALSDGGYVVTCEGPDDDIAGITGRRFNAAGDPVGEEFQVNTQTAGHQGVSDVVALPDGGFVVLWQSFEQNGNQYGIFGQYFDAGGNKVGAEFPATITTEGSQRLLNAELLADGSLVVAFESEYTGHTGSTEIQILQSRIPADQIQNGQAGQIKETQVTSRYGSVPADDLTPPVPVASDLDRVCISKYDGNGRLTERTEAAGSAEASRTEYVYDAAGNLITEFQFAGTSAARQLTYQYDRNNRLWIFSDGHSRTVTLFTYDAANNKIDQSVNNLQDPNGWRRTSSTYDRNNRLVKEVFDPEGIHNTDGLNLVQLTQYDKTGNVVGQVNANGATTRFTYDLNNRLETQTDPEGNLTRYQYDLAGNMAYVRDARWKLTQYIYDDANRLTQEIAPGGSFFSIYNGSVDGFEGGTPTVTRVLDVAGNEVQTIDPAGFTTTHYFDGDNRLVAEINGDNALREFEYNAFGQKIKETLYMNRVDASAHDPDRYPTRPGGEKRVTTFEYDHAGRLVRTVHPPIRVTNLIHSASEIAAPSWLSRIVPRSGAGQQPIDVDSPALKAFRDGSYLAVFVEHNGVDGDGGGIFFQRFSAELIPLGDKVQVNNFTLGDQLDPRVVELSNQDFIVVWETENQDGSGSGVYGRRFDHYGNALGGEFQIHTHVGLDQVQCRVTDLADGGFVATWTSMGLDGDGYGVFAQRFDAGNAKVGGEVQVNTHTANYQFYSTVTTLEDSSYVVAWTSYGQDGDSYGVYGQRFSAGGSKLGTEFRLNDYTENTQAAPVITALTDGGFVTTWQSGWQDGENFGIFGQRFNAAGQKVGAEFQVNTHSRSEQVRQEVAATQNGGFIVAWQSRDQDGSGEGIYFQRFDSAGNKLGDEFLVNAWATDGDQRDPAVAMLDNGTIITAYTSSYTAADGTSHTELIQRAYYCAPHTYMMPEERYTYDAAGNQVEAFDKRGHRTVSYYDLSGRLTAQVDPMGYLVEYDYDAQDNILEQRVYSAPLDASLISPDQRPDPVTQDCQITSYAYDTAGRLVEQTSPEIELFDPETEDWTHDRVATRYGYDGVGNMTTRTLAAGSGQEVTEYHYYDSADRKRMVVDPQKVVSYFEYDENGNQTLARRYFNPLSSAHDFVSMDYQEILPLLVPHFKDQETIRTFNSRNLQASQTDIIRTSSDGTFEELSKEFYYNKNGHLTWTRDEDAFLHKLGYDANGNVLKQIGASSSSTVFQYDVAGNRISTNTDGKGLSEDNHEFEVKYNALNAVIARQDEKGRWIEYGVDANGNAVETVNKGIYEDDGQEFVTYAAFDARNRKIAQFDAAVSVYRQAGTQRPVTIFEYDVNDHITREIGPQSTTVRTWNALGGIASQTRGAGTGLSLTTYYGYDRRGHRTAEMVGNRRRGYNVDKQSTLWFYNRAGNMVREVKKEYDGDLVVTHGYDSFNRRDRTTDGRANFTTLEYDQRNRLISQTDKEGNALVSKETIHHQQLRQRLMMPTMADDLTAEQRQWLLDRHTTRYEYDGRDNVVSMKVGLELEYKTTYTASGEVRSKYYRKPDLDPGEYPYVLDKVSYFDPLGRVEREQTGANRRTLKGYTDFDRLDYITDPDHRTTRYTYDDQGNLKTEIAEYSDGSTGAPGELKNITRTYDDLGRLKSIVDNSTGTKTYYTYDLAGNRKSEAIHGLADNVQISELQRYITYDYDNLGQMTRWHDSVTGLHMNYRWNALGQLKETFTDEGYDPDGIGGGRADFRHVHHQYNYDSIGRVERIYWAYPTLFTKQIFAYDDAGNRSYSIDDLGKSTHFEYDANGRVVESYHYPLIEEKEKIATWLYDGYGNVEEYSTYDYSGGGYYPATTTYNKGYDGMNRLIYILATESDWQSTVYRRDEDGVAYRTEIRKWNSTSYYDHDLTYSGIEKSIDCRVIDNEGRLLATGKTVNTLDANDRLVHTDRGVDNSLARPEVLRFKYNSDGQIIHRYHDTGEAADPMWKDHYRYGDIGSAPIYETHYAYANGAPVGESSTTIEPDNSTTYTVLDKGRYAPVQQIGETYPGESTSVYTAREGETLQSIAAQVYGNASLWFVLAEANGLDVGSPLAEGRVLQIPSTVKSGRLTADVHTIYNEGEIIGSSLPNTKSIPVPARSSGGGGCGGILMIIIIVVIAVVASVCTAGLGGVILGAMAAQGLGATLVAYALAGAIVGAVASVAQQGLFMAMGFQDDFSWGDVAGAAVNGLFSGAAQGLGKGLEAAKTVAELGDKVKYVKVAASALKVTGAAANQLIQHGQITSWTSLAAAATSGYLKGARAGTMARMADGSIGADAAKNAFDTINTAQSVLDYTTPWAHLAETYVTNDYELTPTDWANAVSATMTTAINNNSPGKTDFGNRALAFTGNMMLGGALAMFDKNAAHDWIQNTAGNEVKHYLRSWGISALKYGMGKLAEGKETAGAMPDTYTDWDGGSLLPEPAGSTPGRAAAAYEGDLWLARDRGMPESQFSEYNIRSGENPGPSQAGHQINHVDPIMGLKSGDDPRQAHAKGDAQLQGHLGAKRNPESSKDRFPNQCGVMHSKPKCSVSHGDASTWLPPLSQWDFYLGLDYDYVRPDYGVELSGGLYLNDHERDMGTYGSIGLARGHNNGLALMAGYAPHGMDDKSHDIDLSLGYGAVNYTFTDDFRFNGGAVGVNLKPSVGISISWMDSVKWSFNKDNFTAQTFYKIDPITGETIGSRNAYDFQYPWKKEVESTWQYIKRAFEPPQQQTVYKINPSSGETVSRTETIDDQSTTYYKIHQPQP